MLEVFTSQVVTAFGQTPKNEGVPFAWTRNAPFGGEGATSPNINNLVVHQHTGGVDAGVY